MRINFLVLTQSFGLVQKHKDLENHSELGVKQMTLQQT